MLKKIIVLSLLLVGVLWAVLYLASQPREQTYQKIDALFSTGVEESLAPFTELLPEPLSKRSAVQTLGGSLDGSTVFTLTNAERIKQGLPPLRSNSKLDRAAQLKLQDMVDNQYFEHESPTGEGPSDVVEKAGYKYITVGENLAEGDFTDSADLVKGWMDSPGHRANILNTKFEELGVAVKKANLFGREVWIGVQEFGKPLTACPAVDEALKSKIDANQREADYLSQELTRLATELEVASKDGRVDYYNSQVPIYNQKVASYNTLVEILKNDVAEYNASVQSFNACLQK